MTTHDSYVNMHTNFVCTYEQKHQQKHYVDDVDDDFLMLSMIAVSLGAGLQFANFQTDMFEWEQLNFT